MIRMGSATFYCAGRVARCQSVVSRMSEGPSPEISANIRIVLEIFLFSRPRVRGSCACGSWNPGSQIGCSEKIFDRKNILPIKCD